MDKKWVEMTVVWACEFAESPQDADRKTIKLAKEAINRYGNALETIRLAWEGAHG
ncbi:MAG: hypothetical protein FWF59_01400 [Turicibacter sp.]|nr:hypothetical protein [Turicibacter sp.]